VVVFKDTCYSVGMNELTKLSIEITQKRGLILILTKDRARKNKTDLIANLILNGPLFIVSGDEWLPSYLLPRIIRGQTTEVKKIMHGLHTVRASTCYRLLDSLANIVSKGEPILVMEFLHTFYDDDIPLRVRLFKLRECCRELKRLASYRPVIVMTQEMESEDYEKFIPALEPITDKTFSLEPELDPTQQSTLF
jgi:hypothetical protein